MSSAHYAYWIPLLDSIRFLAVICFSSDVMAFQPQDTGNHIVTPRRLPLSVSSFWTKQRSKPTHPHILQRNFHWPSSGLLWDQSMPGISRAHRLLQNSVAHRSLWNFSFKRAKRGSAWKKFSSEWISGTTLLTAASHRFNCFFVPDQTMTTSSSLLNSTNDH